MRQLLCGGRNVLEREEREKERGRKGEKRGWEGGRERPTDE